MNTTYTDIAEDFDGRVATNAAAELDKEIQEEAREVMKRKLKELKQARDLVEKLENQIEEIEEDQEAWV